MTEQTTTYIYIGSTLIAAVIYYLTFRYQAKKIDILEKTIKSQSSLLDDIEKFRKMLDVDEFKKNRELHLETQKLEMTRYFEKEATAMGQRITKAMTDNFMEANKDLLGMVEELIQFPIHATLQQFPGISQKGNRDIFIKQHYPHSADKLIGFCDAIIGGQIPPIDPNQ
jgi:hypothetical protein